MFTKGSSSLQRDHRGKQSSPSSVTFTQTSRVDSQFQRSQSSLHPQNIMKLQRTVGNRTVQRMMTQQNMTAAPTVQCTPAADSLSEDQLIRAVKYNKSRHYSEDVIKQIQHAVGVNDDGIMGEDTARAVATWQAQNGVEVDGKIGPNTYARLLPAAQTPAAVQPAAAETETEQGENTAQPEQGGIISDLVGGLSNMWDSIGDTAGQWWDQISDMVGNQPAQPTPGENTPDQPAPPQPSELDQLMLQERLSIDEIRRARELINEVTDEQTRGDLYEALQSKVEYHSQRDNESTSGGKNIGDVMCNLTSLAMALSYLGVANPDPSKQYEDALEDIRVEKKLPARTTAEGWGGVAKELGVAAEFLGYDLKKDKEWYMANVDPKLREGYAVMMSISGHIVRMQDVTENGLVIDDPYGVVNLQAGEGWSYDKDKKNDREGENTNRGENSVWAWDAVKVHNMRWIAALK
ncbi:MAG: peptidoglycan-binding protein [Anaerolineae bacterium]|nr:peptidoglycan-binding protein [Anaerolineae bacterium]